MPEVVTAQFTTNFVLALSAGNLIGRLIWPSLCDSIGAKKVYNIKAALATPLYLSIPYIINYGI